MLTMIVDTLEYVSVVPVSSLEEMFFIETLMALEVETAVKEHLDAVEVEVMKEELGVNEEKVVLVVVVVLVKVEREVVGEELSDENEGRNKESISTSGIA